MTRVRLDHRSLALLKTHAAKQLPGVQYGHVLEALASGLGFNTWAAFTAHLKESAPASGNSANAVVVPPRPLDILAMRVRLIELGDSAAGAGTLSFDQFEDEVHFLCDIDGTNAEHLNALRILLCHREQFGDPSYAIARMLIADRARSAASPPGWARVPTLDILRDMEYVGPYDHAYTLEHVQSIVSELSSIYITNRIPNECEKLPVFDSVARSCKLIQQRS